VPGCTPIEAQRAWERQAEINVIDRLQQLRLAGSGRRNR